MPRFVAEAHAQIVGDTVTIAKPSGTLKDHLMVAVLAGGSVPDFSGWERFLFETVGGTTAYKAFRKRAGASEPASYAWVGGIEAIGFIATFAEVNPSGDPIHVQTHVTNDPSDTVHNFPSVSPTIPGCLLCCVIDQTSKAAMAFTSPLTERLDFFHSLGGVGLALGTETLPSKGATGTREVVSSFAVGGKVLHTFAIRGLWTPGTDPVTAYTKSNPSTSWVKS